MARGEGGTLETLQRGLARVGVDGRGALVFGAAAALSSTAIVLTQLAEQNELQARHGRLSVGILLFQDLAAIRVTSAGEDRHPDNQPVLAGGNDPYGY